MDEGSIKGRAKQAAGRVQAAAGALTDDPGLEFGGKMRDAAGKLEACLGDAVEDVSEVVRERPLVTVLAALGLGLIVGRFVLG